MYSQRDCLTNERNYCSIWWITFLHWFAKNGERKKQKHETLICSSEEVRETCWIRRSRLLLAVSPRLWLLRGVGSRHDNEYVLGYCIGTGIRGSIGTRESDCKERPVPIFLSMSVNFFSTAHRSHNTRMIQTLAFLSEGLWLGCEVLLSPLLRLQSFYGKTVISRVWTIALCTS